MGVLLFPKFHDGRLKVSNNLNANFKILPDCSQDELQSAINEAMTQIAKDNEMTFDEILNYYNKLPSTKFYISLVAAGILIGRKNE